MTPFFRSMPLAFGLLARAQPTAKDAAADPQPLDRSSADAETARFSLKTSSIGRQFHADRTTHGVGLTSSISARP